ncbi:MAG: hypothetical protein M9962_14485 [Oligoflexia bacterium]|nr:hypothetical protein [Oligoflexia bacterium]
MKLLICTFCLFALSYQTHAFNPRTVIGAEAKKRNLYLSNSIITGGDALANPVNLTGVRWAKNPGGFERIVIDLRGEGKGWETQTPPYFQVGHNEQLNSISVSIRGVTDRKISKSMISRSIAKSTMIADANLSPNFEGDLASLEFRTRENVDIEAFYLLSPPRIVVDVREKH